MSFCSLTKGITPTICRVCVCVLINKRSFEPFMCLEERGVEKGERGVEKGGESRCKMRRCEVLKKERGVEKG